MNLRFQTHRVIQVFKIHSGIIILIIDVSNGENQLVNRFMYKIPAMRICFERIKIIQLNYFEYVSNHILFTNQLYTIQYFRVMKEL